MAYKSSMTVSCWKEHTCSACEAVFRYAMKRQVSAEAATAQAAQEACQKQAMQALTGTVDVHPCPVCGWIQPDMIAKGQKSTYHWMLALGLIGVAIGWLPTLGDGWQLSTGAWVSLVALLIAASMVVKRAMADPNAARDRNAETAARELEAGTMRIVSPGRGTTGAKDAHDLPAPRPAAFTTGAGLLAASAALLLAAATYPTLSGAPSHASWYPSVVGPGDQATYYLPGTLSSVQGYWKGAATVTVVNAKELGLQPTVSLPVGRLACTTKSSSWGTTISGKSVSESSNQVYVTVTLPDDPALAGKTLDLAIDLEVTYPEMVGKNFRNTGRNFDAKTSVTLGSPGVGGTHGSLSTLSQLGALIALIAAVWMFSSAASRLREQAAPTDIHPLEEPPAA